VTSPISQSSYIFNGLQELCLRCGEQNGSQILLIPPLFDEFNKMRGFLVAIMRGLADHNIGTILPDLPGMNESIAPPEKQNMATWQRALITCIDQIGPVSHVAAFRGGCILDISPKVDAIWQFSPISEAQVLKTLIRAQIAADKTAGGPSSLEDLTRRTRSQITILAGHPLSPEMSKYLQNVSSPGKYRDIRTVRMETDRQEADYSVSGTPLWLRSEPDNDLQMAKILADDIHQWASQ